MTRMLSRLQVYDLKEPLPILVLSDNMFSYLSWRIKAHTHGFYNHAMWLIADGRVASQDLFYKEKAIKEYLQGNHRLKFWYNPAWTNEDRLALLKAIHQRLALPRRKRFYNFLGIIGQRFRAPWISSPTRRFCSQNAVEILKLAEPECNLFNPSPADLNRWCQENPKRMEVLARHSPEL